MTKTVLTSKWKPINIKMKELRGKCRRVTLEKKNGAVIKL